jgi:hypothetical protein
MAWRTRSVEELTGLERFRGIGRDREGGRTQPAGAFVGWISSTTIPPPRGLDEST